MDNADIADRNEIVLMAAALKQAHAQPEAEPTGKCLFCGEKVAPPNRFCDPWCRDQWQKFKDKLKKEK
jgi:hypothetical protein